MEEIFKRISSSFVKLFPIVLADDADETSDPQVHLRAKCQSNECQSFFEKLEKCNERVGSKKRTTETCDEEMIDFVHCVDHCVSKDLFSKLA